MSESGSPILTESIKLDIQTPKQTGLEKLLEQLDQVAIAARQANKALAGMEQQGQPKFASIKGLTKDIQELQKGIGGRALSLSLPDLSKAYGLHLKAFKDFLAERDDLFNKSTFRKGAFSGAPSAAAAIFAFDNQSIARRKKLLADALTPTVSSVQGIKLGKTGKVALDVAGAQVEARLVGKVQLAVPAEQVVTAPAAGRTDARPSPRAKPAARIADSQSPIAKVPGAGVQASVEGPIKLVIPAAQIQASVEGMITAAAATASGGVVRDAKTGKFVSTGGGAGTSTSTRTRTSTGTSKALGGLNVGPQAGEFERRRIEDARTGRVRETVARRDASGAIVEETWDNAYDAFKVARTTSRSVTGISPLQQFRTIRTLNEEVYRQMVGALPAHDKVGRGFGTSLAMTQQANALEGIFTAHPELAAALGPQQAGKLQAILSAQAATLRARAGAVSEDATQAYVKMLDQAEERRSKRSVSTQEKALRMSGGQAGHAMHMAEGEAKIYELQTPDVYRSGATKAHYFGLKAQGADQAAAIIQSALAANPRASADLRREMTEKMEEHLLNARIFRAAGGVAPGARPATGEYGRFLAGLKAFTPMGMLANTTKVTGWAAAVTVLYKSVELARYSLGRFIEVGEETARLDVVFRKVGGSTQELTGDILKLASANARDAAQAMDSATEWSRLGLTRRQVGEATKASLTAANVAHMKPEETTKQLSTLMHVFELDATELNGVMGMLTATSQRYNVTLEDLFSGLDRSAATAKAAKVSLGELQALIAVMVGRTGQTGIIVGNTLKNIFTQFSNPTMQRYLRVRGIETMATEGENMGQLKSGSQILRDVFVRYSGMKPAEQADLSRNLAGRLQVGRFQSLMEGYADAQKLAVDSQLKLNAAQEANTRILGTLKAQLTALRVEWDRMMMTAGQSWGPWAAEQVRYGKNILRSINAGGEVESPRTIYLRKQGLVPSSEQEAAERAAARRWLEGQIKATGRVPGFWQTFATVARTNSGMRVWDSERLKLLYETPYERGTEEFQNKVQELHGQAESAALKARLFETVGTALPGAMRTNPEMARSMARAAGSEMSAADAQRLNEMMTAGNTGGVRDLLNVQTSAAKRQSAEAAAAELAERDRRAAEAKAQLAKYDADIQKAQGPNATEREKAGLGQLIQAREELTRSMDANTEARTRALAAIEEELGKTEQALWIKQQYVDLLKQQEMLMQNVGQLSEQGTPESMGSRLDARVGSLRDEVALLEAQRDRLEQHAKELGTPEAEQAKDAVQKMLTEKQGELAAQNSPQLRQLAAIYDARTIAAHRAQTDVAGWAVGPTESHRLFAQEARIREELAAARARQATGGLSDAEATRAKQLEVDLTRTQEQIQTRIVDLARQERQIRMDSLREFNKGILLAGPGEMLQRLQVSQMLHRQVTPGEFFAMSPEVRRMYFEARGGDAGMTNRWEQREMARTGHRRWSEPMDEAVHAVAREQVDRWGAVQRRNTLGSLTTLPDMPLPSLKEARQLADSLTLMNGGVLTVTQALANLSRVVDALNHRFGGGEPRAQGRRFDVSAGFAPGAPGF
ncbi:MAG TPA: phage tail tape measure protein [Candidatus Acidoferrum sp.]|nr:phage tail tape measure protein [Candidatus Acidoferrum sp.]